MGVLDLIFPKTCLDCGRARVYICSDCLAKVRLVKPICPYCEKPSIDGITHVKCQGKFGLDGLIAIWEYEGVIRKALIALKYKYSLEVGHELSSLFLQYLPNSKFIIPDSAALVPVPLYWYRQNFRGFNQSDLIGKAVSEAKGWKFVPDLLIKKKSTTPQAELKGDERRQNLKGVFAVNPDHSLITNRYSLILFDDVFTTGSTLMEAAKTLKRSGIKKVWGLTIAR